ALSGDYRGTERLCRTLIDALPGDLSRKRFGLVAYPAVVAHAFLARALAELGVFDEGRDHGEEAVRLAEALDHPFSLIWACLNLGRLEGLRGEFIRAIMLLERAVALSHEWNIAYLTRSRWRLWGTSTPGRDASRKASPGCSKPWPAMHPPGLDICARRERCSSARRASLQVGWRRRGTLVPVPLCSPASAGDAVTRLGPTTSSTRRRHSA